MSEPETYPVPEHGWTCFHCGETFPSATMDDQRRARDHFGATPDRQPGCLMKIEPGEERALLMRVRRLEAANASLREEIEDDLSRRFYARLASEIRWTALPFRHCSSLRDVFNLFDSMEGRALAAEEKAAALRLRQALLTRALLFYAKAHHMVGFEEWDAPDEPNWECGPTEVPSEETWHSMMVENGLHAAAVLRKAFGRVWTKSAGRLGLRASTACAQHKSPLPCRRCEVIAERQAKLSNSENSNA